MIAHIRRWFLAGIVITVPLTLTLYFTWTMITFVDSWVAGILPPAFDPQNYVGFYLPGYGLVTVAVSFVLIGALTTGIIGRLFVNLSERLLGRVPFIRSLYGASKQVLETLIATKSEAFREVALIQYPRQGVWAIGFVTGSAKGEIQHLSEETLINIFVPTTPNPTSGFLLFFRKEDIIILDMNVEDAVKLVVSGGIVTPPDKKTHRKKISLANMAKNNTPKKQKKPQRTARLKPAG